MSAYVDQIKNGKVTTFKQWALVCARSMGPLASLKELDIDAPLPDTIEPGYNYANQIEGWTGDIARVEAMSTNEALAHAQDKHDKDLRLTKMQVAEQQEFKSRLESLLGEVVKWAPPSSEHAPLKDFMKQQLEGELEYLSQLKYVETHLAELESAKLDGEDWRAKRLTYLRSRLEYCQKEDAEANKRATWATNWLRLLRSNLDSNTCLPKPELYQFPIADGSLGSDGERYYTLSAEL